jgi:hypothetical protein
LENAAPGRAELERRVLGQARTIAAALAAGVLLLTALSGIVRIPGGPAAIASLAALLGIVSPLIGYRLYAWQRERDGVEGSHSRRCASFLRATVLALAVTEGVALLGVVAYWLTAEPHALIGVVTHVILVGAVWPTSERLANFIERGDAGEAAP